MKKFYLLFNFLLWISYSFSQNLVPNPDFEIFGTVPCGWTSSSTDFEAATSSWTSPTDATPDIFSTLISPSCTNYQPYSTDPSCNGHEQPHSGNIFAGFYTQVASSSWREYLQVQLTQPMTIGLMYKVSMYISLSDNSKNATNNIGVGFSTTVTNLSTSDQLGYAPEINYTSVISDTSTWVYLADTILATDAWEYLIIGNFFNDFGTDVVYFNPGGYWDRSYYYVDDVAVEEINILLAPNFSATDTDICEKFCTSFVDSSANNPTAWQWYFEGGNPASSTDQNPLNICYSNPGVFDVTLITTNANGSDTLILPDYITVYPTPPLPTIDQTGYTLTSSAAATYQWQFNSINIPGATNQTYDVLQSGFYTVYITDENGCSSSATVNVLITGIDEVSAETNALIYPNPSSGDFIVELSNCQIDGEVEIQIHNTLGQVIFSSEEKIDAIGWKKEIALCRDAMHCVSTGIYFLEIRSQTFLFAKKVIIRN